MTLLQRWPLHGLVTDLALALLVVGSVLFRFPVSVGEFPAADLHRLRVPAAPAPVSGADRPDPP